MRSDRQLKILELIETNNIETQEELIELLAEAGYKTTQATISRDIKSLKLTKIVSADGHFKYVADNVDHKTVLAKYKRIMHDAFISMEQAGNMLVIHTVPGMAMAVAASIDEMNWSEVAGCIAGDDTIFCAVRETEHVGNVIEKIREVIR